MSLSPKLEVLGQISERARELEIDVEASDAMRWYGAHAAALNEAVHLLTTARGRLTVWPTVRNLLVMVAATAVNWILAGDRDTPARDPLLDLDTAAVPL